MKRVLVFFWMVGLLLLACSKKERSPKLEPGTAAYQLAAEVAQKIPYFDPDKNNVVASTKDFELTTADLFKFLHYNYGQRAFQLAQLDTAQIRKILKQNVEALAEKELLVRAAQKAGEAVSEAEVDSVLNMQYQRYGGEEKFRNLLEANKIPFEQLREEMRKGMLIQNYLDRVLAEQIAVSEEEIDSVYQEDKTASVRHILLSTQGKSEEEKAEIRKKMEGILEEARSGKDFAELAKKYSEDPGSKDRGGLYEDFTRGQMVKAFEDSAFSVPVGDISGIIETPYGLHILKVIERKKESKPLEEVHDQIQQQLKRAKQQKAYKDFLERLKQEANLEIKDF